LLAKNFKLSQSPYLIALKKFAMQKSLLACDLNFLGYQVKMLARS